MTLFTFTADSFEMTIVEYILDYFHMYTNPNDLIGEVDSPEISKQDFEIAALLLNHVKGNTSVSAICNDIITENYEISLPSEEFSV